MCLSPAPAGTRPLIVCVTHISTEAGNVGPQVARIAAILAGLDPAAAVVLGGDFNSDPADARLDPLYHPCYRGGTGRFQEADGPACAARGRLNVPAGSDVINEYTWNRHKLDDIFFSAGDWTAVTADAADVLGGRSDHIALAATATLLP
jgi:endonuclease/exonuclease/phosphatase family metal-dependent hydrolase